MATGWETRSYYFGHPFGIFSCGEACARQHSRTCSQKVYKHTFVPGIYKK